MSQQFDFEKLRVWQQARQLNNLIYQATAKVPAAERYGYTSQIRRAAISICCNIAEGSGRGTGPDQKRFYVIAKGSLMEVMNLIIIGKDLGFINTEFSEKVRAMGFSNTRKLQSLINSRG